MSKKTQNIFEELGFDKPEAVNLKMRADLMLALRRYIAKHHLTQAKAAKIFTVDQPQISRLLNGEINLFSIDKLMLMLSKVDISVKWKIAA